MPNTTEMTIKNKNQRYNEQRHVKKKKKKKINMLFNMESKPKSHEFNR
jgi:hypothetical protein